MKTIIKNVDYLDSSSASAIASGNENRPMKSVDRLYFKNIKGMYFIKIVLKTKNAWGKTIQQTYYCICE